MRKTAISAIIIGILLNIQVLATDWPQWRGMNRDGFWREKGVIQQFEDWQMPALWRAEIANGYSGPTVVNCNGCSRAIRITDLLIFTFIVIRPDNFAGSGLEAMDAFDLFWRG